MYFFELRDWARQFFSDLLGCGKAVIGKVAPFVAVICVHYVPIVLFSLWVFPSFVGFLVEFFWLIGPIFIITTICSWWFYKNTRSVWLGAVFNALMMAWVASTTFPFSLWLHANYIHSGLDVESQRLIREMIRDFNRDGTTVFLTTHNMEEANQLCDRIAIINHGRIAAIDTLFVSLSEEKDSVSK